MKFTFKTSFLRGSVLSAAGVLLIAFSASAGNVPGNLGSGLDVLLREHVARQQLNQRDGKRGGGIEAALAEQAQGYRDISFANKTGQVKVYIHLAPRNAKGKFRPESVLPSSASICAVDMGYRSGVIEAWVGLDDVAALANDKRVKSLALAIKPIQDVGLATSQGVINHRIDQISQDGTGITVGAMSDSYDNAGGAATDVSTGDLPGAGNPLGNTLPVVVVDDPIAGTDEGRAMMQIIHDEAPKAKLGFATASGGQVSFADNIRSLAGFPAGTHTVPGFNADVIVDDLYYSDSPMFGTSLVGRAVNEVAAAGVAYFSSGGNRPAVNGYFSDYRNVPAGDPSELAAAIAGTNLNFTGVDPALYAGGLHNYRTDGGLDVAQTISQGEATNATNMSFQWDDPYDVDPPTFNPTPVFMSSGTINDATPVDFVVPLTAGTQYRIAITATSGDFDAILTLIDPNGAAILSNYDTTIDEEVFVFAATTGNHIIRVTRFASTTGNFDVNVNVASGVQRVTTDFNLLFFRTDTGAFVSAFSSKNLATNQPLELANVPFSAANGRRFQLVIARANIPTAPIPASKLRYVMTVVGGPVEYFDYQTPITFGHNHEAGCISVAAYSPFRPYAPEDFTSPGPAYIYFDEMANRLSAPIIRQKPDVAAQDGVNNTFFGGDSTSDVDTFPNFFGTSAAAPSAAGIAALVLQANGGPGSVTQPQMRTILQRSGYDHDLDPLFSSGSVRTPNGGKLSITARGFTGNGNYSDTRNISVDDLNSFAVTYVGPGSVSTLSINLSAANNNGGSDLGPVPGLVWDRRARTPVGVNSGFIFTVGSTQGGITAGDIMASYSMDPPAPASIGNQFYQLDLTFTPGAFTGGRGFTFGADRDELRTAVVTAPATGFGNSADLLGRTVKHPENTASAGGAVFSGMMNDGSMFSGTITNRLGKGYSPLDGYGFINAQEAVAQPLP